MHPFVFLGVGMVVAGLALAMADEQRCSGPSHGDPCLTDAPGLLVAFGVLVAAGAALGGVVARVARWRRVARRADAERKP